MVKSFIVIHHSATPDGVTYKDYDSIKKGHLAKGWRDIGYHWVIEKVNGKLTAIPGRAESDDGAHCPGKNFDGIGICCVGNFEIEVPTEELYQFVAAKCRDIVTRHPIKEIGGHRQYSATACPGKNFDVNRVKQLVKEGPAATVTTLDDALKVMEAKGVITSPDYWREVAPTVKYLNALLINVANKLK